MAVVMMVMVPGDEHQIQYTHFMNRQFTPRA
jgi:hypothetical protein